MFESSSLDEEEREEGEGEQESRRVQTGDSRVDSLKRSN